MPVAIIMLEVNLAWLGNYSRIAVRTIAQTTFRLNFRTMLQDRHTGSGAGMTRNVDVRTFVVKTLFLTYITAPLPKWPRTSLFMTPLNIKASSVRQKYTDVRFRS